MLDLSLAQFVSPISFVFDVVGILLVVIGGAIAIFEWLRGQVRHLQDREKQKHHLQDLRVHFAQKMVFGLEFFLAGDIIRLIATPTQDVLIRVGAIIVIRTILAYFLSREIKIYRERK